ncbi:MAG: hypothetical protein KC493_03925 [Bacteriovoracaceae bacterium]|nr:hypothetical protein [Bacteriovoracaceae bacterium]
MKILITLLFLSLSTAFASQECSDNLDDIKLFCKSAKRACADVKECLVRRDSCVYGKPANESKCNSLHTCMQDNKGKIDGDSKCEYKWVTTSSGSSFCSVTGHFLFSEEACPGRIQGLLNAVAYGLSSAVDQFDCKAVNKKRNEKVESCEKAIAKAKTSCSNLPEYVEGLSKVDCEYSKNFSSYTGRKFSVTSSNSTRVNNSSRNYREERPPHNDDAGGGSNNGNGSSR